MAAHNEPTDLAQPAQPLHLREHMPRSRAEARAIGETQYFSGVPCRYGHISSRQTANGTCMECRRRRQRAYYRDSATDGPASAAGKIQLLAHRLMRGENLFRALNGIFGVRAILCRRLKISCSMITQAQNRGYISDAVAPRIAAVLNVPLSRIPTRPQRLARVRTALRGGMPFWDAISSAGGGTDLCLALGMTGTTINGWRQRGIPKGRIGAVAKLLDCDLRLIPAARGCCGRPLTAEQIAQLTAARRTPEAREKMRQAALNRSRNSRGNRWVKKGEKPPTPHYRDAIDRMTGMQGFSSQSSIA